MGIVSAGGCPQPVVVVGHSFGGALALNLAAARPDLITALVLLDPAVALRVLPGPVDDGRAVGGERRVAERGRGGLDLLHALCLRPGRVLSRDQLLDLTQGRAAGPFERSIDVLISRIRQKIEPDPRNPEIIRTIRSGGYLFTPEVTRT